MNEAPNVALSNATTILPDNTDTTARFKVADIVVTDDALGSETLGLSGTDAADFEIDGSELFLKAGTSLDALTDNDLAFTVEVDDSAVGTNPDDTADLAITVTDATPPTVAITLAPARGRSDQRCDPFQLTVLDFSARKYQTCRRLILSRDQRHLRRQRLGTVNL